MVEFDTRRIKSILTPGEYEAFVALIAEMGENPQQRVVISKMCDKYGITRTMFAGMLRKLHIAEILEVQNGGVRGTYVRIV